MNGKPVWQHEADLLSNALVKKIFAMRISLRLYVALLGALASGYGAWAHAAAHQHSTMHAVSVHNCWIRVLPGKLPSAAYFRLVNTTTADVTLTAVSSDAYARTMLHTTVTEQGMSRMRHVQQVDIPAQHHVDFSPGGLHVMLEQATRQAAIGDTIALTLTLTPDQSVTANCTVRAANAMPQHQHQH